MGGVGCEVVGGVVVVLFVVCRVCLLGGECRIGLVVGFGLVGFVWSVCVSSVCVCMVCVCLVCVCLVCVCLVSA